MKRRAALQLLILACAGIALEPSPAFAQSCSAYLRNSPGDTISVTAKIFTNDPSESGDGPRQPILQVSTTGGEVTFGTILGHDMPAPGIEYVARAANETITGTLLWFDNDESCLITAKVTPGFARFGSHWRIDRLISVFWPATWPYVAFLAAEVVEWIESSLISRLHPFVFRWGVLILNDSHASARDRREIPLNQRLETRHGQYKFVSEDRCIFTSRSEAPRYARVMARFVGTLRWDWQGVHAEARLPFGVLLGKIAALALAVQLVTRSIGVANSTDWWWVSALVVGVMSAGVFGGMTLMNLPREARAVAQEILEPPPPPTGQSLEHDDELRAALTRMLLRKGERSESLAGSSLDELIAKALRSEQPKK